MMQSIFAERLRARRKELGLSQAQLATRIGQHQTSVSRYEKVTGNPTLTILFKLAEGLGVTVDWLAGTDHLPTLYPLKKPNMDKSLILDEELPAIVRADFCMLMNDDGMTGCQIKKNDRVYIRYENGFCSHHIVLVKHREKGYLIRRVFFEDTKMILRAENPDYEDIVAFKDESGKFSDVEFIGVRVVSN